MSGRAVKSKRTFFPTDPAHLKERALETAVTTLAKMKIPPQLKAQTPQQKVLLKKLHHQSHDILFAIGPAGTGKTYMAVRKAIDHFKNGDYDKIVITRPNVASGDDLGFLPGTLNEKMAPWTRPVVDVFMECFSAMEFARMLSAEEVEIAPLAYMRGRTFKNALIIGDEMQNSTAEQMKMFLTRLGDNSRMIVTGDFEGQFDRREVGVASGLADIVRRLEAREGVRDAAPAFITADPMERHQRIGLVRLGRADVVRHPVVGEVLDLYDAT